ncbi:MAG TPA: site-specific DNA-methyltransferase [Kiritimatiellia bacterium]|nr:site-specific DNA-methyltransferase [Kiritimatiellia bacterium]
MPTLDWIGKKAVVGHHKEVPFHLLRCNQELSVGDPGSGNLLVQGDNLTALKALLPYYGGQVKCIYIDPPYNTGNEGWVYNDNVNSPEMKDWLGKVVGSEAEDLSRHDKWLCMMYPRLCLLREFLREDGSIWISMDDSEFSALKILMDEVFGRDKFIAANVWQKRYSRENREAIGDVHEYVLTYANDPERFKSVRNKLPLGEKQLSVYKNRNSDPKGPWRAVSLSAQGYRPNQMYEITSPITGKTHRPPEGSCWKVIEPEYERLLAEGRIYFGKSGNSVPSRIQYLRDIEGMVPWTWWPHEEVGHTDEARKEIQSILGTQTAFDTPKPTRLIERILQIATNPGDLVLDSFSGSGTTGHAVLKLNKAGNDERRFILVEMDSTICRDVTAERLKRVCGGYNARDGKQVESLVGGFRYCELGPPLFDAERQIRKEVSFDELAHHVFFMEMGEPLPKRATGRSPLIGIAKETAVYLLYNGILGDKDPSGGNVLTSTLLKKLPKHDGPKIIYGTSCRISPSRLDREGISFRQVPYEVRVS